MTTITTRAGKGSPLTNTELDNNFTNLNTAKYESGNSVSLGSGTFSGLVTVKNTNYATGALRISRNLDTAVYGAVAVKQVFGSIHNGADVYPVEVVGGVDNDGTALYYQVLLDSTDKFKISPSSVVFNESSADTDFRVESDANANMLYVDATNDAVGIGGVPITSSQLTAVAAADTNIVLKSNNNYMTLVQDAAWNSVILGGAYWSGQAKHGVTGRSVARLYLGHDNDATPTSQGLLVHASASGTVNDNVTFEHLFSTTRGGTFFNDDGLDRDFRVESDSNANMLFVDAGNNRVGVGAATPYKTLEVEGDTQLDATNASLWLKSGAAGTHGYVNWTFNTDDTVYAKAGIDYDTRASTGFHIDSGYPITIDYSHSGSDGLTFAQGGTTTHRFNNAGAIFNEGSSGSLDFRVESDGNSNMLFVDASENKVAIGGTTSSAQFTVNGSSFLSYNYYKSSQYTVPTATSVDVYWTDTLTTLNHAYMYEVTAVTVGTGTDTGRKALVWRGANLAWNIRTIGTSGDSSNHPILTIEDNKIKVSHSHGSSYGVRVNVKSTLHGNSEVETTAFGPEALLANEYGSRLRVYGDLKMASNGSTPDATTSTYEQGFTITGGNMRLNMDVSNQTNGGAYIQTRHLSETYPDAYYALNLNPLGGNVVVNNEGGYNGDFRVESDTNTHALFVDASTDKVSVGTGTMNQRLTVAGAIEAGTSTSVGGGVALYHDYSAPHYIANWGAKYSSGGPAMNYGGYWSTTPSSGFYSTYGNFSGSHASLIVDGAQLRFYADSSNSNAGIDGAVSLVEYFSTGRSGTIINDQSADHDFRVESDGDSSMLFLDASANFFGVRAGYSPDANLTVGTAYSYQYTKNMAIKVKNSETAYTNHMYLGTIGSSMITDGARYYGGGAYLFENANASMIQMSDASIRFYNRTGATVNGSSYSFPEVARITTAGLTFNGDTAAANALNDYEEGTWDCRPSTSQASVVPLSGWTISSYGGHYTKVGRVVTCTYIFEWSNTNSSSSVIYLVLPFASASGGTHWAGNATEVSTVSFPSGATYVTVRPEQGNTYASFKGCGHNLSRVDMKFSNFGAIGGGYALGTFTYHTDA